LKKLLITDKQFDIVLNIVLKMLYLSNIFDVKKTKFEKIEKCLTNILFMLYWI